MTKNRRLPWRLDEILSRTRSNLQLTLKEVSSRTKERDPDGEGISEAHISRIERGLADPTITDFFLLCAALEIDTRTVFPFEGHPWFVIRRPIWTDALEEVKELPLERAEGAHKELYNAGVYRYLPLDAPGRNDPSMTDAGTPALSRKWEARGRFRPTMRAYVFEVGYADPDLILSGVDEHPGEEIIWVLDGVVEVWFRSGNVSPDPTEAEWITAHDGDVRVESSSGHTVLTLRPGDTAHYSSLVPHAYRTTEEGVKARALFVFSDIRVDTRETFHFRKGDFPPHSEDTP